MKTRILSSLVALVSIFLALMVFNIIPCNADINPHYVMYINNCSYPVWVGQFGQDANSPSGGWKMDNNSIIVNTLGIGWNGRLWPRTGCTFNEATGLCPNPSQDCCVTGGCIDNNSNFALKCAQPGKPPVSLFETFLDINTDKVYGPIDLFDISYVDGFGVPLMVTPVYPFDYPKVGNPGLSGPAYWCKTMGHAKNPACPNNMMLPDNVSCYSPCQYATTALGLSPSTPLVANICCSNSNVQTSTNNCQDNATFSDHCCATDFWAGGYGCSPYVVDNVTLKQKYNDNEVCKALDSTSTRSYWGNLTTPADPLIGTKALQYVQNVHASAPGVYSWQFDDSSSTYTCRLTNGMVNYVITFCPTDYVSPDIAIFGIYMYGTNSGRFGMPSGNTVSDGKGNYVLTFTNGDSIMAASDGYMYVKLNGTWLLYTDIVSPNGVQWNYTGK
ncbi:MAG: hypothetical protein HQK95_08125 [Nitrospirae bacterium]|nr:hypothetical protein [Nitrospirota bacterium]